MHALCTRALISRNPSQTIKGLLESNDPPLEAERLSLLATEYSSSDLLVVLKEKIGNVQQMLEALLDGQAKVTENLRAAKALLQPIRSVPDDVLSYIFSFCVYEVYDLLEEDVVSNSLDSRQPPWTLSQVCRSWRRVALSTASLWKCISLDFSQYREPENVHLHPFMLGLHLQRARHCQLTIRLSSIKDISSHVFIPMLLSSTPYWKHLHARIPIKSLEVLSTYRGYFDSLHSLRLILRPPQEQVKLPIRTFEMAHGVRVLDITSALCSDVCLPDDGKDLTNLTIHGPFVKHIFSLLGNTPNIEILKVHFHSSKPFERLNSPIMIPKVTNLIISEWDGAAPSSIAHLFESLELPALPMLGFNLDNLDSDSTIFVFPEILPYHHCRGITAFTVNTPRSKVGKAGLIDFLTHITNLGYLGISAKVVDGDLFSAFTRSNNDDDILPRLIIFDLNSESIPEPKMLLEMVESRQTQQGEGVARLRKLQELYLDAPLTFDDSSRASCWQSLLRSGLICELWILDS